MQHRYRKRFILALVTPLLLLSCSALAAQSLSDPSGSGGATTPRQVPERYDKYFHKYQRLLPVGTDWRLLKAQCYQESRLDPRAVSPVGAMGLCQFMPGTWEQMQERYDLNNPWRPDQSIRAAAIYMNQLHSGWSSPRPAPDRYMLALASYNAGFGNLLAAQRKCDMAVLYSEIIECLPQITGHHSRETKGYVKLIITRWYPLLIMGY